MKSALFASAAAVLAEGRANPSDIYSKLPTTRLGCECSSECHSGTLFECNVAEVCTVKSKNCAKGTADWSVTKGYYDWCTYEPDDTYEAQSAATKKSLVLAHVNKDAGTSGTYPSTVSVLTGILGESVVTTFISSSDVFPEAWGRTKYIHSVGVTGGIRFDSEPGHAYTGLFEGAEHGIMRLSSAKEPSAGGGTAPGMGVKFFRDGRPSANFVAMYSLDGQPTTDTNFFAHDWNNHIPMTDNFGLKIIAAKFWQASYCPLMVGLSDLSSDASGKAGVFPFNLNFRPLIKSTCVDSDYVGCLKNLESIPVGTKLFEVRAQAAPNDLGVLIGTISVTEAFHRSKFGDEELFFKHQHMEDDYALKPEWLAAIDRKSQCGMGCTGTVVPPLSKGCSSPFNNLNKTAEAARLKGMLQDDVVV